MVDLLTAFLPRILSVLSYTTQDHLPRGTAQGGLENAPQAFLRLIRVGIKVPSTQSTLECVKLTKASNTLRTIS